MKLFSFRDPEVLKVTAIIVAGALITSALSLFQAMSQGRQQLERGLSVAAKAEAALLDGFYVSITEESLHIESEKARQILFDGVEQRNENVATLGESAMLFIGWKQGDSIEYLFPTADPKDSLIYRTIPFDNSLAMKKALAGLSGTVTGKDYRGVEIIAAYEPIPHTEMGLVIKIDSEDGSRSIWAMLKWLALLSVISTLIAVYLAVRVLRPVVKKLQLDKIKLEEEINRRKGLEIELMRAFESYRDLVENINDVFYEVSTDGTVTYVSPVINKVLGYQPTQLLGKNFAEYLHPEDLERTVRQFKDAMSGNSYPADFRILKSDGSYCWIRTSSQAIIDSGRVSGTRGVFMDISERKSIESDLEESLEWLRAITDTARDGVVLIDDNGQICFWNPAAEELFGYSAEIAIGKNVHDLIAPEALRKEITCPMAHWKSTGQGVSIGKTTMFDSLNKNGKSVPIELSLATTEIRGKRYAVGLVRDITERTQTESELRESEHRFRTVVETLSEGLVITTLDGTIVYVNQRISEMTGYEAAELLGHSALTVIAENHRAVVAEKLASRSLGASDRYEVELRRKNGETFWVQISAVPYSNPRSEIVGSLAVLADITERRDAENARHNLESQLRQAQKMEAIGTLAGGIAHDFNNILTPILAYSELAAGACRDEQTVNDVKHVIDAALRAKELVKQILTFSRQTEHERMPLSPAPIIKEALKLLRASLPTTIDIRHNIQCNSEILADPTQIHQIVFNLCTNAAHAMRDNGGIMEIELLEVVCPSCIHSASGLAASQKCLKLSVTDTGCGMDDGTLSHIFDPFFTTKEVGEGTGLGLSVVHGIVKSSGGEIRVESAPNKGTRFELYFPLVSQTHVRKILPSVNRIEGNERILLVDDEPDIAESCSRSLELFGYQVTVRTSSIEGFEAFMALREKFDLVITDYTMPHRTGVQLAKMMKEIRPDIPIILMTGYSQSVNEENLESLGLDAVVLKPVVGRDLASAIRKLFDKAELV